MNTTLTPNHSPEPPPIKAANPHSRSTSRIRRGSRHGRSLVLIMRVLKPLILFAVCLVGCASPIHTVHHLSKEQRQRLVLALGHYIPDWGAEIQKLKPLETYHDGGNICVVLLRDKHTERGLYYMPSTSSGGSDLSRWKFMDLGDGLVEYERPR